MASFRNSGAPMDRTPRNALFLGTKSFKSSYRRLSVCKAKTVCTSWRQARLVSAQPIDEFVVQICQTQEAHCNIARGDNLRGLAVKFQTLGGWRVEDSPSAAISGASGSLLPRLNHFLPAAPEGLQDLALHSQQPGLDRCRPAKRSKKGGEAVDELLLDRCLRQILRDDCCLEGPILLGIL